MSWYPCCCTGERNVYVPCCVSGIVISIIAKSDGGGVQFERVTLTKGGAGLTSADHAPLNHLLPNFAGIGLGSRKWYFFGLDPVSLQDVFTAKQGFNWRVDCSFRSIFPPGIPTSVDVLSIQLGFSFLNDSLDETVVFMLPTSASAPGWINPNGLLDDFSLTSFNLNPCQVTGTIGAFFGPLDWHMVPHLVTEQTTERFIRIKWPVAGDFEDRCMQRLIPTNEPDDPTEFDITPIVDCQDEDCINKCSCIGLRTGDELLACDNACTCSTGLTLKTGMPGDVFPHPQRYILSAIGEQSVEWTAYSWSRDDAENRPGTIFWRGLQCAQQNRAGMESLILSRITDSLWRLRVWTTEELPFDLELEAGVGPHDWFFWAVRCRLIDDILQFTLKINQHGNDMAVESMAPAPFTVIGDSGVADPIPTSLDPHNNFAGCYSGLNILEYAVSDEFLIEKADAGCDAPGQ